MSFESDVVKYLPLVRKVVNRIDIKSHEYEKDDLFNIGVIGLMDALKRFDSTKKASFETYASIRIRGAVIDEVRKTSRISRHKMSQLNAYYREKEKLEKDLNREVTEKEICVSMNLTEKELSKIHETLHYLASVSLEDTIFSSESEAIELKEVIEDHELISADELLMEEERKNNLTLMIQRLTEREQIILNLYYVEELTLKDIAEILEVSVPRVSQLHGKIILKLRELMGGKER